MKIVNGRTYERADLLTYRQKTGRLFRTLLKQVRN